MTASRIALPLVLCLAAAPMSAADDKSLADVLAIIQTKTLVDLTHELLRLRLSSRV